MTRVLAADVGRTTTRLAVDKSDPVALPNGASLADRNGVEVVLASLHAAADGLGLGAVEHDITHVVVGATGAAQSATASVELADALRDRYPSADIIVTSDVVTAHVGALAGGPGVLVIAGTGAVALGIAADGHHHLVDGWGYLVGDAGSGAQVGRAGLEAALRHADGRPGGSPALAAAARTRFGALERLATTVQGSPHPIRDAASFAVDVAAVARSGDVVAARIWAEAAIELAATTGTAVAAVADHQSQPVDIAVAGSLFDLEDLVLAPVMAALTTNYPTARFRSPDGDALAGAVRLASAGAGVHDDLLLQVPARGAAGATADGPPTRPGAVREVSQSSKTNRHFTEEA